MVQTSTLGQILMLPTDHLTATEVDAQEPVVPFPAEVLPGITML